MRDRDDLTVDTHFYPVPSGGSGNFYEGNLNRPMPMPGLFACVAAVVREKVKKAYKNFSSGYLHEPDQDSNDGTTSRRSI